MALTDLTGTSWTFNDSIDFSLILQSKRFNINATTSFGEATSIYIDQDNISFYLSTYGADVQFYDNSGWFDSNAKTIIISGGTDATNLTLISFIESNATKNITDLTGTAWVFNNTLLASPYTGYTKTIHVDITCNNVSYDTMLLMFSYGLEPSIVTGVYVQNEGESGSVIQIYNDSTGSVDDGWVNDNYKTITFTGGEDIADSDFVSWVQQNASIKVYDVVVIYNNSVSIRLDDTGTAILDTEGTYLTDDITIEYIKPSAITVSPLSITSNGTYTASSGTAYSPVTVNVSGGATSFIENLNTFSSYTDSEASRIADYVFAMCSINLTTVSFASCLEIGRYAFSSCYKLSSVYFPECQTVGYGAFAGCASLASSYFPKCSYVSEYAFRGCRNMLTASFPSCVSVDGYAFCDCYSLQTISFPICTTISGVAAFGSCRSLSYADFPSCTAIGSLAFASCSGLTSVSFPLCSYIYRSAFYGCTKIQAMSFPICKTIESWAFGGCSSLTTINLPICEKIGSSAFGSCYEIQTMSFPSCTTIGSGAFTRCRKLIELRLEGSSVAKLEYSTAFSSTPIAGYTTSTGGVYGSIYVPSSLYSIYISSTNWIYFSSRFVSV